MLKLSFENIYFIYAIVGISCVFLLLIILAIALLFKNSRYKTLAGFMRAQLEELAAKKQALDEENYRLTNENTRLKADYANSQKFMEEKLQYIEQVKNEQTAKFKEISGEIIRLQSQQINENQKLIDDYRRRSRSSYGLCSGKGGTAFRGNPAGLLI